MQPRNTSPFYNEFFDFERIYTNPTIKPLLENYGHKAGVLPLLDKLEFSPVDRGPQYLHESRFARDEAMVRHERKLIRFHHAMAAAKNANSQFTMHHYTDAWEMIFPLTSYNLYCLHLFGHLCKELSIYHYATQNDELAVVSCLSALQIQITSYKLSQHHYGTDIASSLAYLGVIFYRQRKHQLSEMCYQYALQILTNYSPDELTDLIAEIYFNSSLNYFKLSQCEAVLRETNLEILNNSTRIEEALFYLSLANKNLAIRSSHKSGDDNKLLELQEKITSYIKSLNKLKLPTEGDGPAFSDESSDEAYASKELKSALDHDINSSRSGTTLTILRRMSNQSIQLVPDESFINQWKFAELLSTMKSEEELFNSHKVPKPQSKRHSHNLEIATTVTLKPSLSTVIPVAPVTNNQVPLPSFDPEAAREIAHNTRLYGPVRFS